MQNTRTKNAIDYPTPPIDEKKMHLTKKVHDSIYCESDFDERLGKRPSSSSCACAKRLLGYRTKHKMICTVSISTALPKDWYSFSYDCSARPVPVFLAVMDTTDTAHSEIHVIKSNISEPQVLCNPCIQFGSVVLSPYPAFSQRNEPNQFNNTIYARVSKNTYLSRNQPARHSLTCLHHFMDLWTGIIPIKDYSSSSFIIFTYTRLLSPHPEILSSLLTWVLIN